MKRVVEKGNLAFNHMFHICNICKRWGGEFTEDDIRICKYNTDGKGLKSGLVRNHLGNYKCKYHKRDFKYYTCRLQSKYYRTTCNGITDKIEFKKGKFIRTKNILNI